MKCDNCNKPATVHLTEIKNGKKIEKHLCQECASTLEDFSPKGHLPINELLTNFVMAHSGLDKKGDTTAVCENCGISWEEFRKNGLLGCSADYQAFEQELSPLLQRAHEGATHHVGKTPLRRGASMPPVKHKTDLVRLRKELAKAVEKENYELAAKLRDQIKLAEEQD
ncbi:MAG: UvrB/UvrC motif-containing protein [Phycisphaerales bacterium]|nr:UvrB/UvrC motif-containing protein [Phycisphaerales bacterium]